MKSIQMTVHAVLLGFLGAVVFVQAEAKDIGISANNTNYSKAEVQKLAATAVGMGVKEPVSLNLQGGNLTVSGSTSTSCVLKVGTGNTPKIAGISCK